MQGGLPQNAAVAAPWVARPARPAGFCAVKRKLRVEGPHCSGPRPRLTPHMAKVHRRLAIKGRTSLLGKMTQGLLLCKQPQKKHWVLLRAVFLSFEKLQMHPLRALALNSQTGEEEPRHTLTASSLPSSRKPQRPLALLRRLCVEVESCCVEPAVPETENRLAQVSEASQLWGCIPRPRLVPASLLPRSPVRAKDSVACCLCYLFWIEVS